MFGEINWDAVGSIGDWFSGFGAFAAVVVALYLARVGNLPKLKVNVSYLHIAGIPRHSTSIEISAVNI